MVDSVMLNSELHGMTPGLALMRPVNADVLDKSALYGAATATQPGGTIGEKSSRVML